jgi:hypothetical protein
MFKLTILVLSVLTITKISCDSVNPRASLLSIMNVILSNANLSQGSVALNADVVAPSSQCYVTIRYRAKPRGSTLRMIFKTPLKDNTNNEVITWTDDADLAKETVLGGKLTSIENNSVGRFCVQGILYSCGSDLVNSNSGAVILDVTTIRNAWLKQGNIGELDIDYSKNCVWFSDRNDTPNRFSVFGVDIAAQAFSNCANADEYCISNYVKVR